MSLSCSILTRPTPGAPRRAYSQATTAVLWEPCGRGGAIRRQFIWLVWFIWFVSFPTKRTKQTKQTKETRQTT